jgi:riboflavin kinase/FMN adenylyltransferase
MRIVRNLNNIESTLQNSCLTIGNFDGLHLGHKEILQFSKKLATKNKQKSALLTFEPHPRHFFKPDIDKNVRIHSLAQKLDILRKENLVDIVFLIHFNQDLVNLSADDFIKKILTDKLKIKNLIVGYDFSFGKNRSGNSALLKKLAPAHDYNFYQVKEAKNQQQQTYSSTIVRDLISRGDVQKASQILGRNYEVKGTIVRGKQLGRQIGFKTANILPRLHVIKPKFGVYKSITTINGVSHNSITNFGVKPTFNGNKEIFESHIFDFDKEVYFARVKIELLEFIREEMKFDNIEALKAQIQKDCHKCQDIK